MRKLTSLMVGAVIAAASLAATTTPASANPGVRNVRYGDTSQGVRCVQHALNKWNVSFGRAANLAEDSVFGDATLREVKYFQDDQGLDADGVVGPRTGNYLLWELSNGIPPWQWLDPCKYEVPSLNTW
ncbi:peptidoglycan-binding protein [Kitasatospora herbaricolor]|uniref:peptidoglycan-binding domain-containing protein n=1 Tax=Kitasatospora herbaricolor TaxID=68217 RepID=UPI0036DE38CB